MLQRKTPQIGARIRAFENSTPQQHAQLVYAIGGRRGLPGGQEAKGRDGIHRPTKNRPHQTTFKRAIFGFHQRFKPG